MPPQEPCHCGSQRPYDQCCQIYLLGQNYPETAEQLMRSRYSAFVENNENYLRLTWAESHSPTTIHLDSSHKWLGLKVLSCEQGCDLDELGWVHFIARYRVAGKAKRIEERSRFCRQHGRWVYAYADELDA